MTLKAFLHRVVRTLDEARVPYMLTGSLAAAYYAVPRSTQDVDLVIDGTPENLETIIDAFRAQGFYVSPEAARVALETRGQFNAIDPESGWKVDLIVRKNRPFSRTEFDRRRPASLLGIEIPLTSAEDLILAKLEWAMRGESERQLRDVVELLRDAREEVDRPYIERWAKELGIEREWKIALRRLSAGGTGPPPT